jgi:uncharacterized protein with HEPN domain
MLLAAKQALAFAGEMDRTTFDDDEKTQFAVVRALEILGEAASHVSETDASLAAALPWTELRGLRTILAHEYFRIDLDVVWDVLQNELPAIIATLEEALPEQSD